MSILKTKLKCKYDWYTYINNTVSGLLNYCIFNCIILVGRYLHLYNSTSMAFLAQLFGGEKGLLPTKDVVISQVPCIPEFTVTAAYSMF